MQDTYRSKSMTSHLVTAMEEWAISIVLTCVDVILWPLSLKELLYYSCCGVFNPLMINFAYCRCCGAFSPDCTCLCVHLLLWSSPLCGLACSNHQWLVAWYDNLPVFLLRTTSGVESSALKVLALHFSASRWYLTSNRCCGAFSLLWPISLMIAAVELSAPIWALRRMIVAVELSARYEQ